MIKSKNELALSIMLITMVLILTSWLSACKNSLYGNNGNEDKVMALTTENYSKHFVNVDRIHSAKFMIPVIVDIDLNKYNTGIAESNPNIYMVSCEGENISDLRITEKYNSCHTDDVVKENGAYKYYICVFDFEVSAKDNWSSSILVRKITKINFKILNVDICVPVDITVETSSVHVFSNESSIILNDKYNIIKDNVDDELSIIINWDIMGWGATDWTDPNYAEITGLYFEHGVIELVKMDFVHLSYENGKLIENVDEININEIYYLLETAVAAMSGTSFEFTVKYGSVDDVIAFVSDNLIMEYTINGDAEKYTVNIANVQIYNYKAILQDYYANQQ